MDKMELPKEWVSISYNELFTQVSTINKKIKTKDMLEAGKYPVIDQSESFISGFYNDEIKLVHIQQPVIVFGDHTRCFKWIDFNFVPGADGIQVLLPNEPLEARYMFYALKSLTLPNKGYSRHFKFLKEKRINIASLNEQKEIVRIIESHLQLVDQIKSHLDALSKILEQFRQSVLSSAVSGKLTEEWRVKKNINSCWLENSSSLGEIIELAYGKSLPAKIRSGEGYSVYGSNGEIGLHDEYLVEGPFIIVGRKGSYGEVVWSKESGWPIDTTYYVVLKENYYLKFIFYLLKTLGLNQLNRSTTIPGLNRNDAYEKIIYVPSLVEQKEIVARVENLFTLADQIESKIKSAQERVNLLTQSILAKAFRGEFTAKWREENPDLISGKNSAEALLKRIEEAKKAAKKKK
ncbi:restriction endonuclease subunit S [Ignatzschineria cameli]|uniref:restriction endonuclease subunit S n=1 Tax=Ignatzschineria cameli TaxID=2182793 RepID=UPI000D60C239|nr:restriction endonuclease subunit S [Ignatzschineria cameli]PWD87443.1 hypothetical protein DC080_01070 [Ignatzschineria cameli]